MNIKHLLLYLIGLNLMLLNCKQTNSNERYLDNNPPATIPKLFAPSIVNTDSIEINTVFNSSFTELFFTRIINKRFIIHHSELVEGNWTLPEPIQMFTDQEKESVAIDPSISQDGSTMYFLGISPEDRLKKSKPDIYKSEKIDGKWQRPTFFNLGETINEDWIYFCPYMSPDNNYFFFSKRYSTPPNSGWKGVTKGEVYWVNSNEIFKHKEKCCHFKADIPINQQ